MRPDDRVAIFLERGPEAAAAFFGVAAAGGIGIVVGEALRPRQIEHIVRHSGASFLVTSAGMTRRLPRLPRTDASPLFADEVGPTARTVAPAPRVSDDVALLIYTSGSTGLPKGVAVSHGNLGAGTEAVVSYLGITAEDRIASLLPFSFDYGFNQLLCAVYTGATLVVERSPVPAAVVDTLESARVSVLPAVPPLWLQLLEVPAFTSGPLPHLRVMTNTGGHLPVTAVRALRSAHPGASLVLMYGLTEAFRATYLDPAEVDRRPDSIGRAIPGSEILVLREDLTPCDPGEVGELVQRGSTVALGYWADPDATDRVYRPHPLRPKGAPATERVVFSGDLVRRDEDGFLHFVGRRDRMIKSLGYRVSPDEVVDALHASDLVSECVVTSEPDGTRGSRIVAHVVLRPRATLEALTRFSRAELPRYMQPARFDVRTELPHTSSGKHDPRVLERGGVR
jgi:acyl-CoA synthetase (AMP-forming)/AMP-acid ligase II